MGSSEIRIPQECILRWFGNFSKSFPYLCTIADTELISCCSMDLVANSSSSSFGKPNAFPTSRKIDLYLNSTLVPQNATCSFPYLSKIYCKIVSLFCQLQSISKSGGVLRFRFRKRSKYRSSSSGQISVIPRQ